MAEPDLRDPTRMPLIDRVVSGALDDEYVEVARRRGPPRPGVGRARIGVVGAIALLAFAVLVTVSFQQTRDNEDVADAGRATLEQRITTRRAVVSRSQDRIVALRADNSAEEATLSVLDETGAEAASRLRRLRVSTGFSAVAGEGLRMELGDNPDGDPKHRIYDEDLALLTNGLWRAGAEAISVNGQRLTALSAFRFSGVAIRVNGVSLSPPYTVLAIGDTRTLAADLLDTSTGLTFEARRDAFGFQVVMQNEDRLELPAAPARLAQSLRSARAGSADDPSDPALKEAPP